MYFSILIFILFIIEFSCIIGFKMTTGEWTFRKIYNQNIEAFEPHPYLIGMPRKSIKVNINGITYSHNSDGFRGVEFEEKSSRKRIIAIGGSTTYGIGVNDHQTWVYYLDSLLQSEYEVFNLGVPGHSSVEHLIMSSFLLSKYQPDIVIVHTGLNDIRNMHVADIQADYSNFHAPTLYESLGFCYENKLPRIATVKLLFLILQKLNFTPQCPIRNEIYKGTIKSGIDTNVLKLYERNLVNLNAILIRLQTEVIYVPQMINQKEINEGKYRWWAPFVADSSFETNLKQFNSVMKWQAEKDSLIYADTFDQVKWQESDFADPSHLNQYGNLKFAHLLANIIKQNF